MALIKNETIVEALNLLEEIAIFDRGIAGDRALAFMKKSGFLSKTMRRMDGPDEKVFSINDMRHLCQSVVETFGENAPGAAAMYDPDYLFPIEKEDTDV